MSSIKDERTLNFFLPSEKKSHKSSVNEKKCFICLKKVTTSYADNRTYSTSIKCSSDHIVCFACFAGSKHSHLYHSLEKIKPSKKKEEIVSLEFTKSSTSDSKAIQLSDNDDSEMFDINHITSVLNGEIQIRCPYLDCKYFFTDTEIANIFAFCLLYFTNDNQKDKNSASQFQELRQRYYDYQKGYAEFKGKAIGKNIGKKMSEEELEYDNLRTALSGQGTRQCNKCGYGPLLHSNCSSITTHQNEMRESKDGTFFVIDNRCPKCNHMESDWEQYPRWNGQFPTKEDKQIIEKKLQKRKRDCENRISEQNDREFRLVMILDILYNEFNSMEFRNNEEIKYKKNILQEELAKIYTVESRAKAKEEELRRQLDEVTFQEILKVGRDDITSIHDIDYMARDDVMCNVLEIDEPSVKSDELPNITHFLQKCIQIQEKIRERTREISAEIERLDEMKARLAVFALRFQQIRGMSLEQLEEEYRKAGRHEYFLSLNESRQSGSFNARNHCQRYPDIACAVYDEEQKARPKGRRRGRQAQSNLLQDLNRLMGLTILMRGRAATLRNGRSPQRPNINHVSVRGSINAMLPSPQAVQAPSLHINTRRPYTHGSVTSSGTTHGMPLASINPNQAHANSSYDVRPSSAFSISSSRGYNYPYPTSSSAYTADNMLPLQQQQLLLQLQQQQRQLQQQQRQQQPQPQLLEQLRQQQQQLLIQQWQMMNDDDN